MNDLIIKVSKLDRAVLPEKSFIGNDGENLQCNLVFIFTDSFVDGEGRLEYQIGEDKYYAPMEKIENGYSIPIKNVVTKEGNITFQLVVTEPETEEGIPLFKSDIFNLYCKESVNGVEEAPEGYELWIDIANEKIREINEAIAEVDNLDIEVETYGGITYIILTDKEGNTKRVAVNNGTGIVKIEKTHTVDLVDTYTIYYSDGTTSTFDVTNGNYPINIEKTGTSGLVDTYTITYGNSQTATFTVTNGQDGEVSQEELDRVAMIYNVLPRVSETGTSPSLDDTAECPLDVTLKGNSYQYTTSGKNLFNKEVDMSTGGASKTTLPTGIRVTQTTAGTFKNVYFLFGQSELLGKTITLHSNITASASNNGGILVWFGSSSNPFASRIGMLTSSGSTTINIPSSFASGTDRVIINFYSNRDGTGNVNDYVDYTDLQIELSSSYSGYEPYTGGIPAPNPDYPENIQVATGYNTITISNSDNTESQTYPINLGKNLYKNDNTTYSDSNCQVVTLSTGNRVVLNQAGSPAFGCVKLGEGELLGKTVTFTAQIQADYQNAGRIEVVFKKSDSYTWSVISGSTMYNTGGHVTFTIPSSFPSGYDSIWIRMFTNLNSTASVGARLDYVNVQVELGTTKTDYANYFTPIELCKIDDYQDVIFKNTTDSEYYDSNLTLNAWYVKKTIGELILNGSENWADRPSFTYADRFVIENYFNNIALPNKKLYSNYFLSVTSLQNTYPYILNNDGQCVVNFSQKGTTTLAQFKTWLGTHNTKVYYALATPTYTRITNYQLYNQLNNLEKAISYDNQTNITQTNADYSFIITATGIHTLANIFNGGN